MIIFTAVVCTILEYLLWSNVYGQGDRSHINVEKENAGVPAEVE